MNGCYIYYSNIDEKKPTGIQKKILYQIETLKKYGNNCELFIIDSEKQSKYRYFLCKIPFIGRCYDKWVKLPELDKLDYFYIRRPSVFDKSFIEYFKKIKREHPNIVIIVELPTFPYDAEYGKSISGRFYQYIDCKYRRSLYKVIDRFAVVAYSGDEMIWNIPVLPISNGIDLNKVKIRKREQHDTINLLCIAYFSAWHGYDKVLKGVKKYYQKKTNKEVHILMVGDGPELKNYKHLVETNNLNDYVTFFGEINGDLDDIYSIADIGVCSLRSSDMGIQISSQLKSREYLARGLPIITAGDIDILQDTNFKYEFISHSDEVDIEKVVSFYIDKCHGGDECCTKEIRVFAEEYCSWDYGMETVINYLGLRQKDHKDYQ